MVMKFMVHFHDPKYMLSHTMTVWDHVDVYWERATRFVKNKFTHIYRKNVNYLCELNTIKLVSKYSFL